MHPRLDSEWFHGHRYGVAICWTNVDDPVAAEADAKRRMALERWIVDRVVEVSASGPRPDDEIDQRMFRDARREGFATSIDLGRRIHVDLNREVWTEDVEAPLQRMFVEFCQRIRVDRVAFLLYSKEDGEFGTTTLLEQGGLPIWSRMEDAKIWMSDWDPSYQTVKAVPLDELLGLLDSVEEDEEEIIVGFDRLLITFPPGAVRELLVGLAE